MKNDIEVLRVPIYDYIKSGKVVAILRDLTGYTVFELTRDLTAIDNIRQPKFVKQDMIATSSQFAEISKKGLPEVDESGNQLFAFRLVRVLSPEDTDEGRWLETESLDDLPVSPLDPLTKEERIWAGERPGTIGFGIFLVAVLAFSLIWLVYGDFPDIIRIAVAGIVTMIVIAIARHEWRFSRRPEECKVERLLAHKKVIRESAVARLEASKTEFDRRLEDFGEWGSLSPSSFEVAIARRLEKEGFAAQTTRFSGDGGVDVEAVDADGSAVIVQAKQYAGNVGVAVVREMIGVRESRADRPRVIVFALNGFTKGAIDLAASSRIELRSIRREVLKR